MLRVSVCAELRSLFPLHSLFYSWGFVLFSKWLLCIFFKIFQNTPEMGGKERGQGRHCLITAGLFDWEFLHLNYKLRLHRANLRPIIAGSYKWWDLLSLYLAPYSIIFSYLFTLIFIISAFSQLYFLMACWIHKVSLIWFYFLVAAFICSYSSSLFSFKVILNPKLFPSLSGHFLQRACQEKTNCRNWAGSDVEDYYSPNCRRFPRD